MKLTTNYSLKKPEGSDVVNIDDFNYNADIIDNAIQEIKNTSSTNKTNISSLQTDVDNIYGGNKKLSSEHFVKSYPGKYFSSAPTGKDLNNIKFNIICYTTSGDGLINLPSDENGGSGMLEVTQSFLESSNQHTIQRYTNTVTNATYIRSFNKDKDVWTAWREYQAHKLTQNNGSGITLTTGYNLNNLTGIGTGFYYGTGLANSPETGWVMVEHVTYGNSATQKCTSINSAKIYTRRSSNGTWSEWREL